MALENFIEMRDKVGDAHFLFRKKVHHFLGNHFPGIFYFLENSKCLDRFISRYEMVSFTNVPYKEAKRLGEIAGNLLGVSE
jgi:kynurenine 3-monooxygenase